ncbi:MAG: low molecular weight protein-tyrosine-phosphatase [Rhodobacter sp.]|nr:low molecular weight protein-tyrosine-phosphatase [Rhodobacter sp.]
MVRSVLFVCLGNICRSPTAEGVFGAMAARAGLDLRVDSAGLGSWHLGDPPYGPAIRAAAARGYDLSGQRARQVRSDDFDRFDLILGMDADNIAGLEHVRPPGNATPVRLFLDYAPETGVSEVPDPYYTGDFEKALDLVEAAARGLIKTLLS